MNYFKRLLFGILLVSANSLFGQTPLAFTYQAVATDVNGDELTTQSISIKALIVSGSIGGTVEWEELHYITTDIFGLFAINIGEGNPNGGQQSQFANIDWSTGPFFLRIEMDVNGGNSFVLVGTNQLLSVPYSLHADKADKAITASFADSSLVSQLAHTATIADTAHFSQLSAQSMYADTASFAQNAQFAFGATNAQNAVNAQNAALAQVAFEVLNDNDPDSTNELQNLEFIGDTIRISDGNFITLSSASIYNLPGASLNYPQGFGDVGSFIFIPDQYTVPPGKFFYMVSGEEEMRLPGVGSAFGNHLTKPHLPILGPNTMIDNCRCIGFLTNQTYLIDPVILVLAPNGGSTYSVPVGRFLVIKSGMDGSNFLSLNNIPVDFFSTKIEALVIPGGTQIKNTGVDEMILTGYLGN